MTRTPASTAGFAARAAAAFGVALAAWSIASPSYSAALRMGAASVLPWFETALSTLAGSPGPPPDLASALAGLPLASLHVNAVALATVLLLAPRAVGPRPARTLLAAAGLLVTSHLVALLFLVDWSYMLALGQRGASVPAARLAASAVGFGLFCRLAPFAVPLLALALVAARPVAVGERGEQGGAE